MCGSNHSPAFRRPRLGRLPLALALLVSACHREPPPAPAAAVPQVLRLSQRNEPSDFDPATATLPDEFAIAFALSEGLLSPAGNGAAPRPGVAARYDVSPDGLTYTFHLRPDARWSNGDAVTADDFVASYRRLLTPTTASPKASVFYPVQNARAFVAGTESDFARVGFRAVDEHTLVVTLEHPTPRFPYYVASGPWLPVHLPTVTRFGRKWTEPANFVGNGPFLLAEWRPQQRIVVKKNPRWHGAMNVTLEEIQFVRFDSGEAEERAYRAGQIDATMAVPTNKLDGYARERPAELHRAPMIETRYLAFNTRRPPLTDPRVRRALTLALDREKLVDRVLKGHQEPATRFVPPALRAVPEAHPLNRQHHYDPKIARQLLAAAGLDAKNFPRLELTGWTNSPLLETIQAMWRQELGIDVRIAVREAKVHLEALTTGDYDIGFITAIPDVADAADLLGDFMSAAPENYPQWHDPGFDDTFRRALLEAGATARAAVLLDAEQQLLQAAPVTPLYFNTKIWLMSPRVRGWEEDGLWTRTYQNIHFQ